MTPPQFYGGVPVKQNEKVLAEEKPHVVVCTPGRCLGLIRSGKLKLDKVKHFVVDECDKVLSAMDMRKDVQSIFTST